MLNPDIGRMAERMMHEYEDGPLTYYAARMANADDVVVYGYRRNSTRREPINGGEFSRGRLVDHGASLQLFGEKDAAYTGLHISRADMRRKIHELQKLQQPGAPPR